MMLKSFWNLIDRMKEAVGKAIGGFSSRPTNTKVIIGAIDDAIKEVLSIYNDFYKTRLFRLLLAEPFNDYHIKYASKVSDFSPLVEIMEDAVNLSKICNVYLQDEDAIYHYRRQMFLFYHIVIKKCRAYVEDSFYSMVKDRLERKFQDKKITIEDLNGATIGQFYCVSDSKRRERILSDVKDLYQLLTSYVQLPIPILESTDKCNTIKSFSLIGAMLRRLIALKEDDGSNQLYTSLDSFMHFNILDCDVHMCTRDGKIINLYDGQISIMFNDFDKVVRFRDILFVGDTISFFKMLFFGRQFFSDMINHNHNASNANNFVKMSHSNGIIFNLTTSIDRENALSLHNPNYPYSIPYDGNMEHLYTYSRYYFDCNLQYKVLIDEPIKLFI